MSNTAIAIGFVATAAGLFGLSIGSIALLINVAAYSLR